MWFYRVWHQVMLDGTLKLTFRFPVSFIAAIFYLIFISLNQTLKPLSTHFPSGFYWVIYQPYCSTISTAVPSRPKFLNNLKVDSAITKLKTIQVQKDSYSISLLGNSLQLYFIPQHISNVIYCTLTCPTSWFLGCIRCLSIILIHPPICLLLLPS
jgi:hypothetical protein